MHLFTWISSLKYTKSGRSCTRIHWIEAPVAQLCRTGSSRSAFVQICAWQLMQVFVGGIPAYAAFSTCVWQYWHCSPSPSTWCLWLNGTGWSGRWPCRVTHGDRCSWSRVTPSAMTITPVNTRLNRASAFELRSKTCAMSAFLLPLHYLRLGVEKLLSDGCISSSYFAERSVAGGWGRPRLDLPVKFVSKKLRV